VCANFDLAVATAGDVAAAAKRAARLDDLSRYNGVAPEAALLVCRWCECSCDVYLCSLHSALSRLSRILTSLSHFTTRKSHY
jgi:hypothetical protein